MVVLDASVWVAVLLTDEPRHTDSANWLHGWMRSGQVITVPSLFVVEVGSAVARRKRNAQNGLDAIHDIRHEATIDVVELSSGQWDDAAELAAKQLVRGADAVYVALAADLGLPLVTWDREVLAKAASVVDVRTPDQLPV